MAQYILPDLPFDPGALEPHISGRIMALHHGKHHAAYVKNAKLVARAARRGAPEKDAYDRVPTWSARWPSTCRGTSSTRSSGRA